MIESPREAAHRLLEELIDAAVRGRRADRVASRPCDARGPLAQSVDDERRSAFIAENRALVALQRAVATCAAVEEGATAATSGSARAPGAPTSGGTASSPADASAESGGGPPPEPSPAVEHEPGPTP